MKRSRGCSMGLMLCIQGWYWWQGWTVRQRYESVVCVFCVSLWNFPFNMLVVWFPKVTLFFVKITYFLVLVIEFFLSPTKSQFFATRYWFCKIIYSPFMHIILDVETFYILYIWMYRESIWSVCLHVFFVLSYPTIHQVISPAQMLANTLSFIIELDQYWLTERLL